MEYIRAILYLRPHAETSGGILKNWQKLTNGKNSYQHQCSWISVYGALWREEIKNEQLLLPLQVQTHLVPPIPLPERGIAFLLALCQVKSLAWLLFLFCFVLF